jgi:hypothetical protein
MRRPLLITIALLALTNSRVSAGGVNLAWNDCLGAGGLTNRSFTCDTNVGNNDLYVSYDPPVNIPDLNGAIPLLDLQSATTPLPQWWQFKNAGTCRLVALSALGPNITGTCPDSWAGVGVPGIAAYYTTSVLPSLPLDRARILGVVSIPSASAQNVNPGTEYFCLGIRISNIKTVGPTACSGCMVPVTIVLSEVVLTTNNSGDFRITNPLTSNTVTWQGGPTPTQNRTWGQIKSIYR